MTDKEEEVAAAKLRFIWCRDSSWNTALQWNRFIQWQQARVLYFVALSDEGITIEVRKYETGTYASLTRSELGKKTGFLRCIKDGSIDEGPIDCHKSSTDRIQFLDEWLPLFQRNCYLSGCPIDAVNHEKMEWGLWLREEEEAARAQESKPETV